MKRFYWFILIPLLAGSAYFATRRMSDSSALEQPTTMVMPATAEDGLTWLKTEFHLGEAEYKRIKGLHEGYLPGCRERCMEIGRVHKELVALIQQGRAITQEIKAKLDESAKLRAHCHEMMLAHFYEVAAAMPSDAAKRYLEWVTRETLMD